MCDDVIHFFKESLILKFNLLHPRMQIILIINRIYRGEMTTLSGGNLSVVDEKNNIWITPAAIDKGNLQPEDIVCINPEGNKEGRHKPSSEHPFHRAIYKKRPDLRAIVHAHPPGLIAYSLAGKVPQTRVTPQAYDVCGPIGYAPYAMMGSQKLGENIALTFSGGFNIAMLENHGVVCGGTTLLEAFQRMETLEFCARTLIAAKAIGEYHILSQTQLEKAISSEQSLEEFHLENQTSLEHKLRQEIVSFLQRACSRQLMFSKVGAISTRLDETSFLISSKGADRCSLEFDDIVLIRGYKREKDKYPSRYVDLHHEIYMQHPEINCVMTSQPPHAMAFVVTGVPFISHTIPECYVLLRDVPILPYETLYQNPEEIAGIISNNVPVVMIANNSVITTGTTMLEAFDRLEVLEYSARSLLSLPSLGDLRPIDEKRLKELRERFY